MGDVIMDRRSFLKAGAGVVALAGGIYTSADGAAARARLAGLGIALPPAPPRRLSDTVHQLAQRALSGEHGRGLATANFTLDTKAAAGLSPDMQVARAIMLLAERAPLRILPGEELAGSAIYAEAPRHMIPATSFGSISHLTLGFDHVLRVGYKGLRAQIADRLARGGLDERGEDLLRAMTLCLDAADVWRRRHIAQLERRTAAARVPERDAYLRMKALLERVPDNPPESFHEALQSLWFSYAFQRLAGNWPGIGRIDEMLGPYLERDLRDGRITRDEARELLAQFWVKGCEWIGAISSFGGSGDAQHYQNIILAGVDADGREVTNDVTYLVLDVVEELHISDFPIGMRLNARTPESLLRRVAEVQRYGGGIVAVYNEDLIIPSLVAFGYELEEARRFANDGCWEVQVPGKTHFIYVPFDALALLQEVLSLNDSAAPIPDYPDFESLYAAFRGRLQQHLDWFQGIADTHATNAHPCPLISLFTQDCIERGRGYCDRGARYNVMAPHAGGMANVANSLLAIRTLVYEQQYLTLAEYLRILRDDWQGHEGLRQLVLRRIPAYGNDDDEADAMMRKVYDDYTGMAWAVRERHGVLRPAGISTFGREIGWRHAGDGRADDGIRTASADGHRVGEYLATNFSPSPGTDVNGPTAALKSYCSVDLGRLPNGGTLELKIHPSTVAGDEGVDALVGLMRAFVTLGGFYLHIDVMDTALLVDAQRHPEKYPNLSVRVAGWSARFATLDKDWQDMIIHRTQQLV
jgi:pyruvate-formate lyase